MCMWVSNRPPPFFEPSGPDRLRKRPVVLGSGYALGIDWRTLANAVALDQAADDLGALPG
jgi:hypothetical protein